MGRHPAIRTTIAVSVALVFAWPAQSGQCGYEYCWGAIAIGPGGATGRATGRRTAPWAADAALESCGADCQRPEVFYNACGAIAEAPDGQTGFAVGTSRQIASNVAIDRCEEWGAVCRLREWACSW